MPAPTTLAHVAVWIAGRDRCEAVEKDCRSPYRFPQGPARRRPDVLRIAGIVVDTDDRSITEVAAQAIACWDSSSG